MNSFQAVIKNVVSAINKKILDNVFVDAAFEGVEVVGGWHGYD